MKYSLVFFGDAPRDNPWQVWDEDKQKPIGKGPTLEAALQDAYPKCGAVVIPLRTLDEDYHERNG